MSRACRGFSIQSQPPARAASIFATSIFFIVIIASKARLASAPPAAIASVSTRGVICQERPQRSLHQPHALSWPPLLDDRVPVAVRLLLIVRRDLEGKRLALLERRAAVETEAGNAAER